MLAAPPTQAGAASAHRTGQSAPQEIEDGRAPAAVATPGGLRVDPGRGIRFARRLRGRLHGLRGEGDAVLLGHLFLVRQVREDLRQILALGGGEPRSEEHTSELQSRFGISYAV